MNINLLSKKFVEFKKSDYQQHGLSKLYHRTIFGEPVVMLKHRLELRKCGKKVLNFRWQKLY